MTYPSPRPAADRTASPRATAEELMVARGVIVTRPRGAVAAALFGLSGHVSPEELIQRVRAQHPTVSRSTVYRTVNRLAEVGLAHIRHFETGTSFEWAHEGHHDHLVCTRCGAIAEFEDTEIEKEQRRVAHAYRFALRDHRIELYGLCRSCQAVAG